MPFLFHPPPKKEDKIMMKIRWWIVALFILAIIEFVILYVAPTDIPSVHSKLHYKKCVGKDCPKKSGAPRNLRFIDLPPKEIL